MTDEDLNTEVGDNVLFKNLKPDWITVNIVIVIDMLKLVVNTTKQMQQKASTS